MNFFDPNFVGNKKIRGKLFAIYFMIILLCSFIFHNNLFAATKIPKNVKLSSIKSLSNLSKKNKYFTIDETEYIEMKSFLSNPQTLILLEWF